MFKDTRTPTPKLHGAKQAGDPEAAEAALGIFMLGPHSAADPIRKDSGRENAGVSGLEGAGTPGGSPTLC